MSDFYRTGMGHQFFEGTMFALVDELKRLNDTFAVISEQLERLLAHMDKAYAQGYQDGQKRPPK